MNDWAVTLAAWLLDFGLLATAVLAASLSLRWCFRHPAQRIALAWGTWLGLAALAAVTALPQWPRVSLQQAAIKPLATVVIIESELPPVAISAVDPVLTTELPALKPQSTHTYIQWTGRSVLALTWLATAGLAALWIAAGMWQTWRLVRRSTDAPAWIAGELQTIVGKARSPGVRLSQRLSSAAAVGAVAPRILLPEAASCSSQRKLVRAALAHEWAHIRHGDLWLLALERLLVPLLAWQPLFWWLRRSVRLDLELLADADAAGDEPVEYAEALVEWTKSAGHVPAGLAALSLWESPHTLSRRVTMLLDPKRPQPSRTGRGWQFVLALLVLALVAALSLVTARPQIADAQEAQPAATTAANFDKDPTLVAIACVILEADREELAAVLPVERRWQPDPETDVRIVPGNWENLLKQIAGKPGTSILSRPYIQTLDGQMGYVQIGHTRELVPPAVENSNAPKADTAQQLGLVIELTPRVAQRPQNATQSVTLAVDLHQADLQHPPEGSGKIVERKVSAEAIVPVGQTVIIAHRPQKAELRPLVLAATVYLVQRDEQEEQQKPSSRAEDLQRVVRQLERQLADRQRETQAQRDQSEALRKQVEDLKAQLAELKKNSALELRTYYPKYAPADKVAEILRTLMEQMLVLTGDPQMAAIKITPNARLNALHVQGSYKAHSAIEAILEKLDAKPAATISDPNAASPFNPLQSADFSRRILGDSTVPAPAPAPSPAAQAERETQVELLKLDLQEAEIGLQAAQKDMDRIQRLRENNTVSQAEVAKYEFQVQAAKIKVMRAKIMLDGAMRQLPKPEPTAEPKPVPRPIPATPRSTPQSPR